MKTCSALDCCKRVVGNGLCCMHYGRMRRHGSIELLPKQTQKQRFDQQWERSESGCWLWTGFVNHHGRPEVYVNVNRQHASASRVSYEIHIGPIPIGLNVCHKCDVPTCVNPDHLFAATQAENVQDSIRKGRFIRGERQGLSKLTEDAVRIILSSNGELFKNLASRFGVSVAQISRIKSRRDWSHITI